MLRLLIAAMMCAGAGAANAGSIEPFKATGSDRTAIIEIGCPACARAAAEKAAEEARVRLEPGEQIFEVREVDGEMKIYRTENWLGGSPVTMVSKASEADLVALGVAEPEASEVAGSSPAGIDESENELVATVDEKPALFEPVIANSAPGIDAETKTSALAAKAAEPFDPSKYELRLN